MDEYEAERLYDASRERHYREDDLPGDAMKSLLLRDFISNPLYAACRVAVTNDGEGAIFIIRTQSGAEHFFSVVDCTTQEGDHRYDTGTQIMEQLGELRRVILV